MLHVYSDFNCPFCFSQHQRILQLGLESDIEWRFIEHAPQLSSKNKVGPAMEQLDQEFNLISQRAAEIEINKPEFCVNTRLAILSYITILKTHPQSAPEFIDLVFKAYWQDGQDISNTLVLRNILLQLSINHFEFHPDAQNIFQTWRDTWIEGDFDRRIPAIATSDERIMLGLQHKENILNFARNHRFTNNSELVCDTVGRGKVAHLYIDDPDFKQRFSYGLVSLGFFNSLTVLISASEEVLPDLIMIDFAADRKRNFQTIEIIKKPESPLYSIPIVYFIEKSEPLQSKVLAFTLGATDIISSDENSDLFLARIQRRIIEHKEHIQLRENASIDSLTGVCNKRQLNVALERFWRIGCIKKIPLAIVMIDIDEFKKYNDHFGHIRGDNCLIKIANILKQFAKRSSDLVARFGGEEFVLAMLDTSAAAIHEIAEDIRKAVLSASIKQAPDSQFERVTVSLGICTATPHADLTPNQVIELADKQLYLSKSNGRNSTNITSLPVPKYL